MQNTPKCRHFAHKPCPFLSLLVSDTQDHYTNRFWSFHVHTSSIKVTGLQHPESVFTPGLPPRMPYPVGWDEWSNLWWIYWIMNPLYGNYLSPPPFKFCNHQYFAFSRVLYSCNHIAYRVFTLASFIQWYTAKFLRVFPCLDSFLPLCVSLSVSLCLYLPLHLSFWRLPPLFLSLHSALRQRLLCCSTLLSPSDAFALDPGVWIDMCVPLCLDFVVWRIYIVFLVIILLYVSLLLSLRGLYPFWIRVFNVTFLL